MACRIAASLSMAGSACTAGAGCGTGGGTGYGAGCSGATGATGGGGGGGETLSAADTSSGISAGGTAGRLRRPLGRPRPATRLGGIVITATRNALS